MNRVIDELIESARLLGATQAKQGFGVYTQEDAMIERALHESIVEKARALRAELAKPVEPATAPKPAAWINGHDLRLLGRQGRGALVWCDNEGNADTPLYLHPPTPAWHDAPTCAGGWYSAKYERKYQFRTDKDIGDRSAYSGRWYGPIQQDKGGEKS